MLRNLHIRNLAIIREVDVDFHPGLNILTGETGAGKSIMIDAVSLALGGRVTRDMLRRDGEAALIELVFDAPEGGPGEALRNMGIDTQDGVILISRKITDGRSIIRINGETVTLQTVRECAAYLLDIHGQSEHQKLLKPEVQLELLDRYGKEAVSEAKEKVRDDYRIWALLKRELENEDRSPEERARRMDFLEYEISEIEEAALSPGEDEELEKRYRRLSNARRIADAVSFVHDECGYDSPESAGESVGRALKKLESVSAYDEQLGEHLNLLSEIDDLLNDFNRALSDYAGDLEFEAGSFEETEERLNLINKLKAKYGRTIEDVLTALKEKKAEYAGLESYEERRSALKRKLRDAEERLKQSSSALTSLRKDASAGFVREASAQFSELNFARADFAVEFRDLPEYTANGRDGVEFTIATNPGEMRRPLKNVVSGGELSRLMLGIRTMFADTDEAGTIIFDEVDTGISGRTAQMAAEKMSRVSRMHQVLCITHLPQIAAMADTHYGITKDVSGDAAITNITPLDGEESVMELARLIGGAEITENTLNSAREMKEMCRQFKNAGL